MALTFAIENRANLPDGGPLDISVAGRRGIDIGRDQHLDWSLPDPARVVSSKHCEVRFRDGAYWLIDVSTNGTFLNGSPHRMQGPHQLRNGDRLEIGHYIINVQIEGEESFEAAPGQTPSDGGSDPWSGIPHTPAPPMNISSASSAGSDHIGHADALDWFADIPIPELPAPLSLPKTDNAWMQPPPVVAQPQALPPAGQPGWEVTPVAVIPAARQITAPPEAVNLAPIQAPIPALAPVPQRQELPRHELKLAELPEMREPVNPPPSPQPFERVPKNATRENAVDPASMRFLELIAHGAGLPLDVFQQQSPEKTAEIIGGLLRVSVDELRSFLQARAETKGLVRSTNQTMIQAFENNPLKFSPSSEEAMRKMLASDNRSYLAAIEAFQQSFRDLKTHQLNTYGAMQQALKMLIEDFDPATIERMTEQESGLSSVMSNRKAKLWEAFSAKWKAKVGRHDNGLVDVFMIYFAECYDRMISKLR